LGSGSERATLALLNGGIGADGRVKSPIGVGASGLDWARGGVKSLVEPSQQRCESRNSLDVLETMQTSSVTKLLFFTAAGQRGCQFSAARPAGCMLHRPLLARAAARLRLRLCLSLPTSLSLSLSSYSTQHTQKRLHPARHQEVVRVHGVVLAFRLLFVAMCTGYCGVIIWLGTCPRGEADALMSVSGGHRSSNTRTAGQKRGSAGWWCCRR
jgi:hypothetical protein